MYQKAENQKPYYKCLETISNKLRIEIIIELQKSPQSVLELSKKLNVEQSRLSHSLKALVQCSFLNVQAEGKKRIYSINKRTFVYFKEDLFSAIEKHIKINCKGKCKQS